MFYKLIVPVFFLNKSSRKVQLKPGKQSIKNRRTKDQFIDHDISFPFYFFYTDALCNPIPQFFAHTCRNLQILRIRHKSYNTPCFLSLLIIQYCLSDKTDYSTFLESKYFLFLLRTLVVHLFDNLFPLLSSHLHVRSANIFLAEC
jgi:hypothetical protein